MFKDWMKLLRVQQYVKNGFVFLPLLFAVKITQLPLLMNATAAFVLFCIVSSAVYILNDIKDVEEDRNHPTKRYRPLASGTIATHTALGVSFLFVIVAFAVSFFFNKTFLLILALYIALNISYSFGLKHISILDIVMVSVGFVLRIFAGGAVTEIVPTIWIILMTFLLAVFISLAKRREDVLLASEGRSTRKNIDGYNTEFINAAMMIMASVIIVSYISYAISPDIQDKFHTKYLYLTVVFVIVGILRYMQITFVENNSGNPTAILYRDRFLQITIGGWLLTFVLMIY